MHRTHTISDFFQPLQRKLPLLISALLCAVVVSFGWLAQRELGRAFDAAATDRLRGAAQRLAALLNESLAASRAEAHQLATDSAVVGFLATPDSASRRAADLALRRPRRGTTQVPARALFGRDCTPLLAVGALAPTGSGAGCPLSRNLASPSADPVPTGAWVQPFVARGDTIVYGIVAPVVRAPGDTVGFLVHTRGGSGGGASKELSSLIGDGAAFLVGNATGEALWTDLSRPAAGPQRPPTSAAVRYTAADGSRQMGVAVEVPSTPWMVWVQMPATTAIAPRDRTMRNLAAIALACIVLGGLGAWMVSQHVTAPLIEVTRAAEDLAAGNYARRVVADRRDELGNLMTSFNRMATQVESASEELNVQAEEAQELAHELEISNQELVEAAEEAKSARTAHHQLEAQLLQAQKMEAVGRLAGGVAHDFNNLLTVITSYADLLVEDLEPADKRREDLGEISRAAERASGLTRQLLAFSRKQVLQPTTLSLDTVVDGVEKMLGRLIGADVELVTVRAPDLGLVSADPGQIEQVIVNLVVNARDAMPDGGRITIETSNVELSEADAGRRIAVAAGPYVMLAVSDTGHGMGPDVLAHLFEPFYTTKPAGRGTGLGLSTVFGIVRQSGGDVWVYSEVGHGTTFKIYLPRVNEIALAASANGTALPAPRGAETILIAEDDDALRALAHRVLARQGYTVIEARNGREALELCTSHDGPIDLVLSDVVMPELGGRALVERLAASRPQARVLFMSGYTDDDVFRRALIDHRTEFLQKPFTPQSLSQRVREVLNGGAATPPRSATGREV